MSFLKTKDFWAPNQFYRAQSRYKSLIAYNNKLYICNTSHTSGETFEENSDKFSPVADSGGQLAGIWDMTPVGASTLPINQVFGGTLSGTGPYTFVANSQAALVSTNNAAMPNDVITFTNYHSVDTYDPYITFFGYVNLEATTSDIVAALETNTIGSSLTFFVVCGTFEDNTIAAFDFIHAQLSSVADNILHPQGQRFQMKMDIGDGTYDIYAKAASESSFNLMLSRPISDAPNGVKPILMGYYTLGNYTHPLEFDDLGGSPGSPVLPNNPVGKRYLVSVGGTYNGHRADSGDIAEFTDINNIIVTRDVNLINAGFDAVVSSLQQQVHANKPSAIKNAQVISVPNAALGPSSTYNYNFVTVLSDMIILDIPSFTDISMININFAQKSIQHVDCLLGIKFADNTASLPAGVTKLKLYFQLYSLMGEEDNVGGSGQLSSYELDLANTRFLLFRYTNGRVTPIGRRIYDPNNTIRNYTYYGLDNFGEGVVNQVNGTDLLALNYPLTYSYTNRIVLTVTEPISVMSIVLNGRTSTPFDGIDENGIVFEISANSGISFANCHVSYRSSDGDLHDIKMLASNAPVTGHYRFVYYPKTDIFIADYRNPQVI